MTAPISAGGRERDYVKEAAKAHTDLCMFAKIAQMAESSDISSARYDTAQKIIKLCQAEQQKCLRDYDRAYAKATDTIDRRGQNVPIKRRVDANDR